jgi:hypothetical protein
VEAVVAAALDILLEMVVLGMEMLLGDWLSLDNLVVLVV